MATLVEQPLAPVVGDERFFLRAAIIMALTIVAGFLLIVRAKNTVVLVAAVALPLALWLLFDKLLDFPLP